MHIANDTNPIVCAAKMTDCDRTHQYVPPVVQITVYVTVTDDLPQISIFIGLMRPLITVSHLYVEIDR